mmetsp:Transcript_9415/g.14469  ORF Transcript_9415/g.14469 Transcript_9415/m.14469 type:complete len:408 (+) Transcript_9415:248-1471(+)
MPVAGKDVELFPAAKRVIESIRSSPDVWQNTSFAIASRTKSGPWAEDLLEQFGIHDFFDHTEIFPGDKKAHFQSLQQKSGIPYNEMLFFDDNRDGRYGNCVPVSELGVLSVHCPGGIHTEDVFHTGVNKFAEWSGKPNTIVEWDGSVSQLSSSSTTTTGGGKLQEGTVKKVLTDKRYGFIRYGNRGTRDLFFHFNNLPRGADSVEVGDKLRFVVADDPKNGKKMATNIQKLSSSSASSTHQDDDDANTVNMRVFSMNLPFAALLANGYKTLETRNGTMFTTYPEGTQMLLHVGRRTYPDGDRHLDVMRSGGLSDDEIAELKSLPSGFSRGMAVAILEIGRTLDTTLEERCDPDFQRKVGAFGADSGRRATEIRRVAYLKKGVRVSGQGGVFKARIDKSVIPDGWNVE